MNVVKVCFLLGFTLNLFSYNYKELRHSMMCITVLVKIILIRLNHKMSVEDLFFLFSFSHSFPLYALLPPLSLPYFHSSLEI